MGVTALGLWAFTAGRMRSLVNRSTSYEPGQSLFPFYRYLIHDVHWCFTWLHGQPGSGEAALDEAGPVLDLLQAVPDDLGQVAEAGDGGVGQHAALITDQMPSTGFRSGAYAGSRNTRSQT
jgi:hypothetical protein